MSRSTGPNDGSIEQEAPGADVEETGMVRFGISTWSTEEDRLEKIRNIVGEFPGEPVGQTWMYRGLVIKKVPQEGSKRNQSMLELETQSGVTLCRLNIRDYSTYGLRDELDGSRSAWMEEAA